MKSAPHIDERSHEVSPACEDVTYPVVLVQDVADDTPADEHAMFSFTAQEQQRHLAEQQLSQEIIFHPKTITTVNVYKSGSLTMTITTGFFMLLLITDPIK